MIHRGNSGGEAPHSLTVTPPGGPKP